LQVKVNLIKGRFGLLYRMRAIAISSNLCWSKYRCVR